MMYHFAFNSRRLTTLFLCLALLAVLSYAAGVVTGIGLWMPTHAEIALLKTTYHGNPATAAAVASSRLPVPAVQVPAVTVEKTIAAATAPAAALPAPVKPSPAAAAPAALPPPPSNPSPFAATAATLPSPAAKPAAALEEDVFSVQLGSFRDPKKRPAVDGRTEAARLSGDPLHGPRRRTAGVVCGSDRRLQDPGQRCPFRGEFHDQRAATGAGPAFGSAVKHSRSASHAAQRPKRIMRISLPVPPLESVLRTSASIASIFVPPSDCTIRCRLARNAHGTRRALWRKNGAEAGGSAAWRGRVC